MQLTLLLGLLTMLNMGMVNKISDVLTGTQQEEKGEKAVSDTQPDPR